MKECILQWLSAARRRRKSSKFDEVDEHSGRNRFLFMKPPVASRRQKPHGRTIMKIRAALVEEKGGPFVIRDVELDDPREDEVLVRVVGSGICHTDLMAREQLLPLALPAVFGHEGSGIVEKVGTQVRKVKPGDHVVLSFLSCGLCAACLSGMPTRCSTYFEHNMGGSRIDGSPTMHGDKGIVHANFVGQSSFATHSLANERSVVKVRKDVPLEILGTLACAVQTGAGGVLKTLRPEVGASVAVFGLGGVGLSAVMASVISDCATIIAVDVNDDRLSLATEFGATHTINPTYVDPVPEIRRITGAGVKYSLECTGIPAVLRQAVDILAMGGTCGMIGVAPAGVEVRLEMQHVLDGRTIRGIIAGDSVGDVFIPQLIELYSKGRLPFDRMVQFYRFEDINQAAADTEKGRVVKPILRFK
jgi:aryl-alcohol dehydrogenase